MQMRTWVVGLALVFATLPVSGCGSHPDHPTVDVTGKWQGLWTGSDGSTGEVDLWLNQGAEKLEGAAEVAVDAAFADPSDYLTCADEHPAKDDSNRVFCTAETEALRECLATTAEEECSDAVVTLDDCRKRRRAYDCTALTGVLGGDIDEDRIDVTILLKPADKGSCLMRLWGIATGSQVGDHIAGDFDNTDCPGGARGTWDAELQPPEE